MSRKMLNRILKLEPHVQHIGVSAVKRVPKSDTRTPGRVPLLPLVKRPSIHVVRLYSHDQDDDEEEEEEEEEEKQKQKEKEEEEKKEER